MHQIKKGDMLPVFTLRDHDGNDFDIRTMLGSPIIIYFYPKDNTAGCTREACAFRDKYEDFITAGVAVIGISTDSPLTHRKFRERYRLPFTLLSDPDNRIRKLFGVPNSVFGMVPGRVTYIVDSEGRVRHVFNSLYQPVRHVKEALKLIRSWS